jgi:hypothetical protein
MSLVTTLGFMEKLSQTCYLLHALCVWSGKSFCHYRNVIVHTAIFVLIEYVCRGARHCALFIVGYILYLINLESAVCRGARPCAPTLG